MSKTQPGAANVFYDCCMFHSPGIRRSNRVWLNYNVTGFVLLNLQILSLNAAF